MDSSVVLLVALAFVGVVLACAGAWKWLCRHEQRLKQSVTLGEVCRRFSEEEVLVCSSDASFEGLDRVWDNLWRGQGVLLLTRDMLYFRPLRKKIDLTVPISRIERVEMGRSKESGHSGQSLLQVSYKGVDDQPRVATWLVDKPEEWIRLVHNVRMRMSSK